ncbi:cell adhesion molecule CEACAM5-like [Ptychodera flava]|uniref:cell adhesion molecule CEACAM5-like n=1 Tax=Ptychodera flava TaxID=63121 RepID=UPI00396A7FC8
MYSISIVSFIFTASGPLCELSPSSYVVADEVAIFNCTVENGVPPGELVWYADGIETTREKSLSSNVWYPVFQREDNGTIVNCRLEHETILPSAEEAAHCEEDIIIVVQYPPTVNITNSTRNVVFEGERFQAVCEVEEVGYPAEIIELYWRGPNNERFYTSTLMLENITRELGGNYTCVASNEYADGRMGEGRTSLILDVQYAPSLDVKIYGNASEGGIVVEGDSFIVECIVTDANPQPHVISWTDSEGTTVSSNELMEFNAVQREQSGNYTCEAMNTFWDGTIGNALIGFSIFVQYIPEVKVTITGDASSTGRVIEGHSFEAECEVLDSNPSHNNVTWFDGGHTVVSPDGLVEFEDVRRKQSGDYTCVATNTFWDGRTGTGTAIMNVNVEYAPVATINDESGGRVVEGREYRGDCSSVGNPAASFAWRNQSGVEIHTGPTLYLSDVKREESGIYTCIATNTFWDASKGYGNVSILLDVQYDPDVELRHFGLYDSSQVIEGDDFSVLCLVDSNPEVDWIAWDDSNADGAWLNFTSVERNKHGDYICTARNTFWDNSTGTGDERISIDVQYPPYVNEQTVFCVEHDLDVRLSCEVNSNPSPSFYAWISNGDLLVREHTYVINKASRSDSGNYTCRATNVFYDETNATDSGVTEVRVQYLSDVTLATIPLHNITEGSDVTIYCQAVDGNPNPHKINLTFEDEIIAESNGSVLYHNLVSISREQDGNYQCNAMTQFYDQREDFSTDAMQITVFYSARISSEESRVYEASVGDDVSMECTAEGNPSPTIRWFNNRNETLSNDDDNISIHNIVAGEVTSTLTLTIGSNSFGIYTCEAYNLVRPSDYQLVTINEFTKASNLDIIAISVTCTVIVVVLIVGIVLGILYYNKRASKIQSDNTDYANAGQDKSAYSEITASTVNDKQ